MQLASQKLVICFERPIVFYQNAYYKSCLCNQLSVNTKTIRFRKMILAGAERAY